MSATRVYWGCTTLAGCDFGFGGTECAMPSDWEFCPSCGGELHEVTSSLGSGATGAQPLGGDHGHGTCRPSCSTDAPQSQARGGASIPGEAPAATGGGEPSCAAPAHASLTPFGVSTTETAKPSNQELVRGWALNDLRVRCESTVKAECDRHSCLEPEAHELAEFVVALVARVEALLAERDALAAALGAALDPMPHISTPTVAGEIDRYNAWLTRLTDARGVLARLERSESALPAPSGGRVAVLEAALRDALTFLRVGTFDEDPGEQAAYDRGRAVLAGGDAAAEEKP